MSAIEKELLKATNLKTKKGEDRQAYLVRLINAVQDLSDGDWDKISPEAQAWTNAGAKADNKKKAVVDFPDLDAGGSDAADAGTDEGAAAKPAADKKKAAAKDKAADAPAKKAGGKAADKGVPEKREGVQVAIKKIMLARPKISAAELSDMLEERGYTVSQFTVTTIRSDFRNSLRVLIEAGLIKMEL